MPVPRDLPLNDPFGGVSRLGGLDFCQANAGIVINAPAEEMTYAQWLKIINVNLNSVFLTDTSTFTTGSDFIIDGAFTCF